MGSMGIIAACLLCGAAVCAGAPEKAPGRKSGREAGGVGVESGVCCERCGRMLGVETPESAVSGDPDFKANGMFQTCGECLESRMDAASRVQYIRVAQEYKWNSISHNRTVRPARRRGESAGRER